MRHAILIGCEKYTSFNDTRFAHDDVDLMFDTLTTHCDFKVEDVLKYKLSKDSDLTPENILDGIESFSSNTNTGNTILFYFAGHGDRTANGTYLILPSTIKGDLENTALDLDKLAGKLRQDRKACIRIFDACHSGADVRDAKDNDIETEGFLRSITTDTTGWVTLAGCAPTQKSYSDPNLGHGIFTYFLCEEIKTVPAGKDVHPELIKVPVVANVYRHAEKLGLQQTPTLNASISGNITIATRKKQPNVKETKLASNSTQDIRNRISEIQKTTDITDVYLNEMLSLLVVECENQFREIEFIDSDGEASTPKMIDYIPSTISKNIVSFVEGKSFNTKHTLKTIRKYKQRSLIDHAFAPNELLSKEYVAEQPIDSPESVVELKFSGDSRCLPDIVLFLYVIPLQISTCNLISVWNYGWDKSFEPKLICNYYETNRVDDPKTLAKSIAGFAANKFTSELQSLVSGRITSLENELSDTK